MRNRLKEILLKLSVETEKLGVDCKRKKVGCNIHSPDRTGKLVCLSRIFTNGSQSNECSNVVGSCGCFHAEPKLVLATYAALLCTPNEILIACTHSPCTQCANLIVWSTIAFGLIYRTRTEHDLRGIGILRKAIPVCSLDELEQETGDYAQLAEKLQACRERCRAS